MAITVEDGLPPFAMEQIQALFFTKGLGEANSHGKTKLNQVMGSLYEHYESCNHRILL